MIFTGLAAIVLRGWRRRRRRRSRRARERQRRRNAGIAHGASSCDMAPVGRSLVGKPAGPARDRDTRLCEACRPTLVALELGAVDLDAQLRRRPWPAPAGSQSALRDKRTGDVVGEIVEFGSCARQRHAGNRPPPGCRYAACDRPSSPPLWSVTGRPTDSGHGGAPLRHAHSPPASCGSTR